MPALVAKALPVLVIISGLYGLNWVRLKITEYVEREYNGDWSRYIGSLQGTQIIFGLIILFAAVIVSISQLFN